MCVSRGAFDQRLKEHFDMHGPRNRRRTQPALSPPLRLFLPSPLRPHPLINRVIILSTCANDIGAGQDEDRLGPLKDFEGSISFPSSYIKKLSTPLGETGFDRGGTPFTFD